MPFEAVPSAITSCGRRRRADGTVPTREYPQWAAPPRCQTAVAPYLPLRGTCGTARMSRVAVQYQGHTMNDRLPVPRPTRPTRQRGSWHGDRASEAAARGGSRDTRSAARRRGHMCRWRCRRQVTSCAAAWHFTIIEGGGGTYACFIATAVCFSGSVSQECFAIK